MPAVLEPARKTTPAPDTYDADLRQSLQRYYDSFKKGQHWAVLEFESFWRKFQRGVRQELEFAGAVSHWVPLPAARVLVIGSYLGNEAVAYALRGARVVGLDLDQEAMQISRELARRHSVRVEFEARDATQTGYPDASFDYISCAQVLEHLPPERQIAMLREIWRLCKPGGHIWIDTPNQMRWLDQHDTGLPFIHWLPRPIKVPLARLLGRALCTGEPGFDGEVVYLHYYLSFFKLKRILASLGPYRVVSKYRGFADADHYREQRQLRRRTGGWKLSLKAVLLRQVLKVWDWNWFASTRVMIQKVR
jgi:2-polyprenyl-3-methyl-5-hydroxy-6-metoxy-1,4-benzoquinol methylase